MSLSKETIECFAGLAGIETSVITDAIASDEEVKIEVTEGRKAYNPDDLDTYVNNHINEAKPKIIAANIEAEAKRHATELGLELNGTGKRDFGTVLASYKDKLTKESGLKPNEIKAQYDAQIKEKDALILTEREKATQAMNQLEAFKFSSGINSQIMSNLGDSDALSKEDRVTLFNAKFEVKKSETGDVVVFDRATNSMLKNDLKSPENISNIVKEFDKKYITNSPGRGGDGGTGGGGSAGTPDEIKKQLVASGLKPGTKEYYTEYNKMLNQK